MLTVIPEKKFQAEMLTVEQFANRMAVGKTTVYDWVKSGQLVAGRHYIRIAGTTRFPWGADLLQRLLEDSADKEPPVDEPDDFINIKLESQKPSTRKMGLQINLDY